MTLEIDKQTIEFIEKNKRFLKISDILRILKEYIKQCLKLGLSKKTLLQIINEQLNMNINYYAFYSFLQRNKLLDVKREKILQNSKDINNSLNKDNDFLGII